MRRAIPVLRALAVLSAAGLLVTACSGGSDAPRPTGGTTASSGSPSAGTSATGTGTGTTPAESASPSPVPYDSLAPSAATPLGSVKARPVGADQEFTLEVLAVSARADSTVLELRLSSPAATTTVNPAILHPGFGRPDIGGIRLRATQANLTLDVTYADPLICFCSWVPNDLGPDGVYLSAMYPPLPASVTQVEVAAPQFPAVTVPVTRS